VAHYLSCALANRSYLPLSDFGRFGKYVDGTSSDSQYTGFATGDKRPLWDRDLVRYRFVGGMSLRVFQEPFLRDLNSRGFGTVPPMKWPATALSGLVVEKTRGLLEVYQAHNVFSAPAGAASRWENTKADHGGLGGFKVVRAVKGPDTALGRVVYEYYDVPFLASDETYVLAAVAYGPLLAQFTFQGGSGVGPQLAAPLVQKAAQRLATACGIGND
jgi:hypothetical protein